MQGFYLSHSQSQASRRSVDGTGATRTAKTLIVLLCLITSVFMIMGMLKSWIGIAPDENLLRVLHVVAVMTLNIQIIAISIKWDHVWTSIKSPIIINRRIKIVKPIPTPCVMIVASTRFILLLLPSKISLWVHIIGLGLRCLLQVDGCISTSISFPS